MSEPLTVDRVVANAARGAPAVIAARVGADTITFAELGEAATVTAARLARHGLSPGDIVLVLSDTTLELLRLFVGCAAAGVVFAPLDPDLDDDTISAVVERVRPSLVLHGAAHRRAAEAAGPATAEIGAITAAGPQPDCPAASGLNDDDPHVAFFTSGSTGEPKAVVLSHRVSVLRSHPGSQLERRGPALCPYPLFHMGGWTITLQQWHARAEVVFVDGTTPDVLINAIHTHRIERLNAIPALWTRMADHLGAASPGALSSLRFADTGTSPTSVELLATIADMAPGAEVRVFYGSTETGNVASLHHDDLARKPGSCGRPSPLTEVHLSSDGEVQVRGPLVFSGYEGDPDATAAAFDDGWFATGDLGRLDDEGYLSIVGRKGELIRTGGEAVAPDRVEAALEGLPGADDLAVFGLPDDKWGEVVWVAVVPFDAAQSPTLDSIRLHLAGPAPSLAGHERPRALLIADAIPRTAATGQVDRRALRSAALRSGPQETT